MLKLVIDPSCGSAPAWSALSHAVPMVTSQRISTCTLPSLKILAISATCIRPRPSAWWMLIGWWSMMDTPISFHCSQGLKLITSGDTPCTIYTDTCTSRYKISMHLHTHMHPYGDMWDFCSVSHGRANRSPVLRVAVEVSSSMIPGLHNLYIHISLDSRFRCIRYVY